MSSTVAVIGAGLGGLSAAIHLARRGHDVHIFERNNTAGGKMNIRTAEGYRFDTGPSLLTMPSVVDELFSAAGCNRKDFFDIVPIDPLCRYFYPDGTVLDAHAEIERMVQSIAAVSKRDAEAYRRFYAYSKRIYDITAEVFLFTPIHEWQRLLRARYVPTLLNLPRIDALRTMHQSVSAFFSDPRIVQLFDRYATYNGSDPFRAPATLNIIPYVEYGIGGYYIRGGLYRLVESLLSLAQKLGVQVHTNAEVQRILYRDKRVVGVHVHGETYTADAVVCNADVVEAHTHLLSLPQRTKKLQALEPSISGMVFLWGVNKSHPQLMHHNILFSDDYRREFAQIFNQHIAPNDPTVYVSITSKSDTGHAPPGCENWFVLLNMPYLVDGQHWEQAVESTRRAVLQKLRNNGLDIAAHIEHETVFTPQDFYALYGSNRGSIYGISSNSQLTAFRRPPNRSRDIQGLFFAGGSTHPGGGVPLVLLSGSMAADMAANYLQAQHRSRKQKVGF